MSKASFNEAEKFLIGHWWESRQLELSMESVRNKYTGVAQRIVEAVAENHEELDFNRVYVTQHWGQGGIGFGRKRWPKDGHWPTGYYVENIRLELLSDEEEPQPCVYLWLKPARKAGFDMESIRRDIHSCVEESLSPEERSACKMMKDDADSILEYAIPEGRGELLRCLADGDSQQFIDHICAAMDVMAKLTPTLDRVLLRKKEKPST